MRAIAFLQNEAVASVKNTEIQCKVVCLQPQNSQGFNDCLIKMAQFLPGQSRTNEK